MELAFQDSGILFTGSLPLNLELLREFPHEHEIQHCNESNELLLKSVAVLEEKAEYDETDPTGQELKRHDMKLNMILDLLVTLLLKQEILPATRILQLSASGLRLVVDPKPADSQPCRVQIYIERAIPKPLTLYGYCQTSPEQGMTDIMFTGVSQSVMDNIDKFIFRQNRRRIAQTRKS